MKSSGLVGLVLVLLSLYLFLNFRVALITAMGIPISFLVAVVALFYLGYTINMVSLFAFLIALGLIVDDENAGQVHVVVLRLRLRANRVERSSA